MAPARTAPSAAEEAFDRGECAHRVDRPSEALACFREALAKDPGFELAQEWIDTLLLEHPELLSHCKNKKNHSFDAGKSRPWWLQHAVALVVLAFALEFGYGCCRLLQGSAVYTEGDHYGVLQVGREATTEEVRKAFREKSKEAHPDKCKEDGCHEAYLAYTRAVEVLSNPAERKVFDLSDPSDPQALLFAKLCGHLENFVAIWQQLAQYDDSPVAKVMQFLMGTLHYLKHIAPWSCGLAAVLGLVSIKAWWAAESASDGIVRG